MPDAIRQLAIQQFQAQLEEAKKQRDPNETDAQAKFKQQSLDAFGTQVVSFLQNGNEATLGVNLDRQAQELSLDLTVSGKPGLPLAAEIAGMAQIKSTVAGLLRKDSAFSFGAFAAMPEDLRKLYGPVIDEAIQNGLKEQKDPSKRELADKLAKVLTPTLKAAELDVAVDVRGPSPKNLYTAVAGLKVKEGLAIDQALRDMVKGLPPEEQAKIKLDAEQAGALKIHRFDVQKDLDEDVRKNFGENPMYVAFRADALFAALGENGLSVLKESLLTTPQEILPFRAEMSVARLAQAMTINHQEAPKLAQEIFGPGKGNDTVQLIVEGGQALKVRALIKAPVIQFFSRIANGSVATEK
jgi:hypothetical protein